MTVRRVLILVAVAALVAAAPARAQEPPPSEPPPEPVIAEGVTVVGVPVGGLTEAEATTAVKAFFDRPLRLKLRRRALAVAPSTLARARVYRAVQAALAAPAGTRLPLEVTVGEWRVRLFVSALAKRFYRPARNTRVYLRSLRPWLTRSKEGRRLLPYWSRRAIVSALRRHTRGPLALPTRDITPAITRANFGPVVVIRRGSRALYLYRGMTWNGMRLVRRFRVAVGQPSYPTPLGRFRIVSMQRNPWWYPPNTGWAAGASPVPPGPGNPLGTRWMGLSVGGVGIHGTYNAASIGGFASHGCIRMFLHEAEWLFERVRVGTTVFIVAA
jgi:hypothetical protein